VGGTYDMHTEIRNSYKISVQTPVDKGPFVRPRFKWKNYIKMGLIRYEGVVKGELVSVFN